MRLFLRTVIVDYDTHNGVFIRHSGRYFYYNVYDYKIRSVQSVIRGYYTRLDITKI